MIFFFDVIHKKLIVNGIYINIFSKRSSVKVLEILLLKNAEVLSTEKIFEMIWTNKKVDNFKVVKTAIFRLRKIIECDHTKPLFIKTSVGNKGYYFDRDVSFCLITEK